MKAVLFPPASRIVAASVIMLTVVGCAGTPAPRGEIGAAEQAVTQARAARAAEYAPLELRKAEEKLAEARSAAQRNDYERSRRSAEAARVDAQLAAAIAERDRSKAAVSELKQSLEALREQSKTSDKDIRVPKAATAR